MSDLIKMEAQVDEWVRQGNTEQASKLLIELIEKNIEAKQIIKAEALREKLMEEVDPMAIGDIVRLGEMIEEAKTTGIDQSFLEKWDHVLSGFSVEEKNAVFYALSQDEFPADSYIYKAHQVHPKLYFINEGEVKAVFEKDEEEVDIKTMTTGDIAGDLPFFTISTTTTSIKAVTDVKTSTLDRSALDKISETHAGIENKLKDYCLKQKQVADILKREALERRVHPRYPITGRSLVTILDKDGNPGKIEFNAYLSDISQGGISVLFKTPQKKVAKGLLNRKINIKLTLEKEGKKYAFKRIGMVVAVTFYMSNEYIMHIKFDEVVNEKTIAQIEAILRDESTLLMS